MSLLAACTRRATLRLPTTTTTVVGAPCLHVRVQSTTSNGAASATASASASSSASATPTPTPSTPPLVFRGHVDELPMSGWARGGVRTHRFDPRSPTPFDAGVRAVDADDGDADGVDVATGARVIRAWTHAADRGVPLLVPLPDGWSRLADTKLSYDEDDDIDDHANDIGDNDDDNNNNERGGGGGGGGGGRRRRRRRRTVGLFALDGTGRDDERPSPPDEGARTLVLVPDGKHLPSSPSSPPSSPPSSSLLAEPRRAFVSVRSFVAGDVAREPHVEARVLAELFATGAARRDCVTGRWHVDAGHYAVTAMQFVRPTMTTTTTTTRHAHIFFNAIDRGDPTLVHIEARAADDDWPLVWHDAVSLVAGEWQRLDVW